MSRRYLPWAVAALYLLFLFPTPEFPPYNADDGSWFVTMGWNLAQYGRYTSDTFPLAEYGHHAAWPPLFASILAALITLAGLDWLALKLLMALIGLAALALLLRLWRDDALGAWAVLLTALSPAIFLYSHHTMTEMPYIAAVSAALLGLSRARDGRGAFLAGLLAVLAFFTRGYAVIFLLAGPLYFILRPWPMRQRLIACLAYILPLIVAVLAWKGYTGQVIANLPLDWISERFGNGTGLLQSLLRSPLEYAQRLYWFELRYPAHFLLPLIPLEWTLRHDLALALSLPLLALIGYGWLTLLLRRRGAVECWLPLALAFMLIPRSGAARYLLPFLPFLFYYLLHGLHEISQRLPRLAMAARMTPYALLLVNGTALAWHLTAPEQLRFVSAESKDYRDVALWAGANLPMDAVVLAPAAHRFLAVSGRTSWPIERLPDPPASIARGKRPIYLLCTPETPAARCAGLINPVQRRGRTALHLIRP
jgi:hypothetical protein